MGRNGRIGGSGGGGGGGGGGVERRVGLSQRRMVLRVEMRIEQGIGGADRSGVDAQVQRTGRCILIAAAHVAAVDDVGVSVEIRERQRRMTAAADTAADGRRKRAPRSQRRLIGRQLRQRIDQRLVHVFAIG